MPDVDSAIKLAQLMVKLGQSCGRRVTAVLSAMSAPLGAAVGNALEVAEAAEILRQAECAPVSADLRRLCLVLAGEMLYLGGLAANRAEGWRQAEAALQDGRGCPPRGQMTLRRYSVRTNGGERRETACGVR